MKKKILASVLAGILVCMTISSCSSDDDEREGNGGKVTDLRLKKLDMSGGVYLTLAATNSTSKANDDKGLFKIDADGNMTAVVLTCIETEDGSISTERTDISVVPEKIISLAKAYTLLAGCTFKNEKGETVELWSMYGDTNGQFNILVRNTDGSIYYIPDEADAFFPQYDEDYSLAIDKKGALYISNQYSNLLGRVELVSNGTTNITQINPSDVRVGWKIWPLDNGTVVVYDDDHLENMTAFYPNGGFEKIGGWQNDSRTKYYYVDHQLKAVELTEHPANEAGKAYSELTIHPFTIGTTVGSFAVAEAEASITGLRYDYTNEEEPAEWAERGSTNSDWLKGLYSHNHHYFIGQMLLYDQYAKQITEIPVDIVDRIIFPTENNTYRGKAYTVQNEGCTWFDIETMTYGEVTFDFSPVESFMLTNYYADVPAGKCMIWGVRNSDGKPICITADIETGSVVCSENDDDRKIVALIPLN